MDRSYHAKAKSSGSGKNYHIPCCDLRTLNTVEGASIWFNQCCFFNRHIRRNQIRDCFFCQTDILCHTAVYIILESKQIMLFTHPVSPGFTKTALSAWHDLLRTDTVAKFPVSFHIFPHLNNCPDKFMPGNHRRFDVLWLSVQSPEAGCPSKCLYISGTDSTGFYF